ncbi:MAG TPA: hypothetical protein H9824_12145, partial [Candidatus Bacteroides pullicola]|nr:hypothetical protein [Candidatus Bacteroides pullicola]
MKRKEQLQQWLGDRRRTYADGLRLFRALASDAVKKRYSAYLEQGADGVSNPFDPRFTQLVNCLSKIAQAIRAGQTIPTAEEELLTVTVPADSQAKEREERQRRIEELKADNEDIATRIGYLEDESGTHADEIDGLKDQMEQNLDEIQQLRKDVDQLSQPGVKIVTEESLTPELKKVYQRIKEIAPLYASLHADITNESTPDEERKKLADKLCDLDDERRALWKQIDDWAEGKGVRLDEKRPEYSDNALVRGYEMARQVKRLRQN